MRNILGIVCVILFATQGSAGDEKVVPSKIEKVTVYSQGAQIYRTSTYTVSKGVTQVIIEGISPQIDPKSLQVKATGNVILLDTKYALYYPKPSELALEGLPLKIRNSINLLEDSILNMTYTIQDYSDDIQVMNATKKILMNNGAVRGQGKVNDSIALLKEAIDYYTVKMMEINKKLQKLSRSKAKQDKELTKMHSRLTALKNHQNSENGNLVPTGPIHRITITLKADEYAKGKLDVSYLVAKAGWIPLYDLRTEVASGKVNLNYKAQVYQNTGIDWDDVRLNISTNNPYQNKTKPTLHPWYVDFYVYNVGNNRPKAYAEYKDGLRKKAEAYGLGSPAPSESETIANGTKYLEDAVLADEFVDVVDHMISAEFRIDLPYSIESNNEQHMVLIKNIDLQANFKYYTVPKYDNSAYLVAQLTKLDELQLVPAKANIFFDGSYLGETYLDPTTMDDTLDLSLGKDPNIIVKRTLLQKQNKEKVIGQNKERTYAYSIEVKNLKSTSIELIIQDQLPITQNADIEIEAMELSKGSIDKRTGIVEWSYTIKPKGKKDILFKYKVKHDKDQNVAIL
ncbi:MAG: hypothetical protein ACI865_002005 [Flavobacteriaceae bacterium]|jgi:uncharacterized protein (TIGR02231 family)